MSENSEKDEKTEDASEKKIQDALEKGQTPVSKEVSIFFTLITVLFLMAFFIPNTGKGVTHGLNGLFGHAGEISLNSVSDLQLIADEVFKTAAIILAPLFIAFVLSGIASSVFQNPPAIVVTRIKPELSRISLKKGRERIFSNKGLVEFAKSVSKILVATAVIAASISGVFDDLISMLYSDSLVFLDTVQIYLFRIVTAITITMALITGFDVFWSRTKWLEELKMTRQEVKDEMKQAMGDPLLKSRQRSVALDRSRNRMMNAVPQATVIIANPTHFSVALRYIKDEDPAPIVVAMGRDIIALRIREIAKEHTVPVIENVQLARSLYKVAKIDQPIPSDFFPAVAQVLAFIGKQSRPTASMS